MTDEPDLTIVLACYNEAEHLESSVAEIEAVLRRVRCNTELIFIDDASRDGTVEKLRAIGEAHPEYRMVYHTENVGRGGTVTEGLRMARGEVAGYFDIDLEISPSHLVTALAMFDSTACDVAVARRTYKIDLTPFAVMRHLTHRVYRAVVHMSLPLPVADTEAGFKFFRKERILPVLDDVSDTGWFWDTEVLVWAAEAGLAISEFSCVYERRAGKTSTVRLFPDTMEYLRQMRRLRRDLRSGKAGRRAACAESDAPPDARKGCSPDQ